MNQLDQIRAEADQALRLAEQALQQAVKARDSANATNYPALHQACLDCDKAFTQAAHARVQAYSKPVQRLPPPPMSEGEDPMTVLLRMSRPGEANHAD